MKALISEIQITPIKAKNGLVGFASFVYDDSFYFGSIGIYTRPQSGYRLTYPTRNSDKGSFNIFHPINKQVAIEIEQLVISEFEKVMKKYVGHNQANSR